MGLTCSKVTGHRPPTPPSTPQPSRGWHANQQSGAASAPSAREEVREAVPTSGSVSLVEGPSSVSRFDPDPLGLESVQAKCEGAKWLLDQQNRTRQINDELEELVKTLKSTIMDIAIPGHRGDDNILTILNSMPTDGIDVEDSQDGSVMATLIDRNRQLSKCKFGASNRVMAELVDYLRAFNALDKEYMKAVNSPKYILVFRPGGVFMQIEKYDPDEYGSEAGA